VNIESLIRTIRGQKVMVDFDLAMLYGVQNKRLNEQVKRNIRRCSHGDRHLGNAAGASPALKEENGKRKSSYRLPFFRLVFEINRLIIWKLQN